ncbi:MAG TPA: ATP phosphoribosyltransferase regulatory subunit, partial [Bacteroidota bacterium]|nr:ATP phosphoribosyltransferase regulatory subunit [Bacteroidota bacterium]
DSQTLATASGAITNEESRAAIAELSALWRRLGRWQEKVVFDLAEIDEMEYYTGVMFTFLSPSHPDELGRGGRYDGLIREFGADMPAIGFSFSVDDLRGGL